MSDQPKTMNRWLVAVGAILVQLCLGAIYAWSVFTPGLVASKAELFQKYSPEVLGVTAEEVESVNTGYDELKKAFDTAPEGPVKEAAEKAFVEYKGNPGVDIPNEKKIPYGFSKGQTQLIFGFGLAFFAIFTVVAGLMQKKMAPRTVCIIGGIVLGAGYVLAGLVNYSFIGQLIFIGIVGGIGIGLSYVVPIAQGIKWFPDMKGLISGLGVAGFGFGALIWIKLGGAWGQLLYNQGIPAVFAIYGIAFFILVFIGSLVMINPPTGYKPEGWDPPAPTDIKAGGTQDFMTSQMLGTPAFYMLWVTFIISAGVGLMVIGNIKLCGIEALKTSGIEAAKASAIAGTAWAVFGSLANGIGRIVWGKVADIIGAKLSVILMCALQAGMAFAFYNMAKNEYTFYIAAAWIGFMFGGNFSLFPTATAGFFGSKHMALNYGCVFTAYGIGGIVCPLMGAKLSEWTGSYQMPFIYSGAILILATIIALMYKRPTLGETSQEEIPALEEEK